MRERQAKISVKLYITEADNAALLRIAREREWSRQHVIQHAIGRFLATAGEARVLRAEARRSRG